MEQAVQDTAVQSDNTAPVTDSAQPVDNNVAELQSDKSTTPSVEMREGKMFVDGQRVYTRDDTNKIASNARREAESRFLNELNVDSLDSVKSVVQTLQDTTPSEEGSSLNVNALRDAVKKREATVEELTAQVNSLKTDLLLKDHMSNLQSAMPGNWNAEQKAAVVKLMKADGMLAVEGDTFAIRHGNEFLTTDGETPDYAKAVEVVGKSLGLTFGKKGVDLQYGETSADVKGSGNKALDDSRLNSDAEYRRAYFAIRQNSPQLSRGSITDAMVKKTMEKSRAKFS
jgi:hypothetical protein